MSIKSFYAILIAGLGITSAGQAQDMNRLDPNPKINVVIDFMCNDVSGSSVNDLQKKPSVLIGNGVIGRSTPTDDLLKNGRYDEIELLELIRKMLVQHHVCDQQATISFGQSSDLGQFTQRQYAVLGEGGIWICFNVLLPKMPDDR